jgi:hypothetical protein
MVNAPSRNKLAFEPSAFSSTGVNITELPNSDGSRTGIGQAPLEINLGDCEALEAARRDPAARRSSVTRKSSRYANSACADFEYAISAS